jgi:hypothetical protein
MVALARQIASSPPRKSLRQIFRGTGPTRAHHSQRPAVLGIGHQVNVVEIAARGHLTDGGKPHVASAVQKMLGR